MAQVPSTITRNGKRYSWINTAPNKAGAEKAARMARKGGFAAVIKSLGQGQWGIYIRKRS